METDTRVEIDIKTELPVLKAGFFKFKEALGKAVPGNLEIEDDLAELVKIEDVLDELSLAAEKKELVKPLNKIGRFLEKMGDKDSRLGKIIEGTPKGIELGQKLGRVYNRFAQWLALPQVPGL